MTVIVACNDQRGGDGSTEVVNIPQKPLTSLLRETSYASLTTKCLTMPRSMYGTEHEPTTKCFSRLLFSTTSSR